MVVAAIQNPNMQISTQNSMSSHSGHDVNLDSLVEPASSHDVSNFHATIQQTILQNSAPAASANSTFSANSIGRVVMNMVDNIENKEAKMEDFAANINHLSMQDTLELQKTAETLSLSVQFLSKGVSMATKAIDTVVHMQ